MKKQLALFAFAAAVLPTAAQAQVDPGWVDWKEVHATLGVRFWRTDWTTWYDPYVYRDAPDQTTVIPVASLRYKNFLMSGSYMVGKKFTFPEGFGTEERKEYDVNIGYFILPGLAATLGWKHLQYNDQATPYKWETSGWTVGLSGSAPIASTVSIYGNMAYGRPKVDDKSAFRDVRGKYFLTELGLAFPLGAMTDTLTGVVVTAGYRYQRVAAVPNGPTFDPVEVFEYTQGPVLGVSYAF
jgi:hypothetical protein